MSKECIFRIQSEIIRAGSEFLRKEGFHEILPPIIAENTDPGLRGAHIATVDLHGKPYCLTASINLQKFEVFIDGVSAGSAATTLVRTDDINRIGMPGDMATITNPRTVGFEWIDNVKIFNFNRYMTS